MNKNIEAKITALARNGGLLDFRVVRHNETFGDRRSIISLECGEPPNELGVDRLDDPFVSEEAELATYANAVEALRCTMLARLTAGKH